MPVDVLIAGLGPLGIAVVDALAGRDGVRLHVFDHDPVRRDAILPVLSRVDAAVCCADDVHATSAYVALCREAGVACVIGRLTEHGATIALDPGAGRPTPALGCPECARLHEMDRFPSDAGTSRWASARSGNAIDVDTAAGFVALALCKALEIARGVRPADAMATALDFDERAAMVEPVAKHHACSVCTPMSEAGNDTLRTEALHWRDRCLAGPAEISAPIATLLPRLRRLTGSRYGLFDTPSGRSPVERQAVWQFFRERGVDPRGNALANAHSMPTVRRAVHGDQRQISEGFDFVDAETAEALSLVEGLERLFALSFCPPRRIVTARYADIAGDALDPRGFPLYDEWQYDEPDFPSSRFDPDTPIDWIWGIDVGSGLPTLVPSDFVFASSSQERIYHANSNGAACHSSVVQAIVNGICETVERDALMVTWLNELSLPRVDIDASQPDPWSFRSTLERLDLQLDHVDIGTDLGIPVLLGVLRDRRNPDFFLVDMVAATDPEAQLRKLHRELAQFAFPYFVDRRHFVNRCTEEDDPDSVRTFADHVAYYQAARRNARADFLTAATAVRRFANGARGPATPGPRGELDHLIALLNERGYRVIVVDCTSPPLSDIGLHAVKVLIPGLQPLNCGHRLRALGGERVLTVAQRMGHSAQRRTLEELNPWPHPFW